MAKLRILLCCAAGMSTSLLVTKMEQAAKQQGIDAEIWAVPESQVEDQLPVDVVLLGPQVRFALKTVKAKVGDIPVAVIDMRDYGTMNGPKVLKTALDLING